MLFVLLFDVVVFRLLLEFCPNEFCAPALVPPPPAPAAGLLVFLTISSLMSNSDRSGSSQTIQEMYKLSTVFAVGNMANALICLNLIANFLLPHRTHELASTLISLIMLGNQIT